MNEFDISSGSKILYIPKSTRGTYSTTGTLALIKPGLHEPQLQVEWKITFLYSFVVE